MSYTIDLIIWWYSYNIMMLYDRAYIFVCFFNAEKSNYVISYIIAFVYIHESLANNNFNILSIQLKHTHNNNNNCGYHIIFPKCLYSYYRKVPIWQSPCIYWITDICIYYILSLYSYLYIYVIIIISYTRNNLLKIIILLRL